MKIRLYQKKENDLYYFQFLTDGGQEILDSQGYQSKEDRNTGINSVKSNASIKERYETRTDGGASYFILKAGNHQEIGRSPLFNSVSDMHKVMDLLYVKAGGPAAVFSTTDKTYKGKDGDDNYKPLSFYEKHQTEADGFSAFEEAGYFYFAYSQGGKVILISESYTTEKGRDNGIQSVTKNMVLADRYEEKTHPNGKIYFNLLAGNRQQIATSRWFDSQKECEAALGLLTADAKLDKKQKPNKMADKKSDRVYLKSGNYHFNDITYQTMKSANDKYYFTFRNAEEKTVLLNANVRGYDTEADVDAAIDLILKYGPDASNYVIKETKNNKFYFYLTDNQGKNVAKSFFFDNMDALNASKKTLIGQPKTTASMAKQPTTQELDDYLPCGDYSGQDGFHSFYRDDRKEYYFALNGDGKTYLRSEGYTTEKARDNGIESVKKNAPIEERWTTGTALNGKYHYYALKAGNHQEIARSCYYSSAAEMEAAFGWIKRKYFPGEVVVKKEVETKVTERTNVLAGVTKKEASVTKKDSRDMYMDCDDYAGGEGFHKFVGKEDNRFYFGYNGPNGKTYLRSKAYDSAADRDAGITAVREAAQSEKQWSTGSFLNEKFYYVIKDKNFHELARSCYFATEAEMNSYYSWIRGGESTIGKGAKFIGGAWVSYAYWQSQQKPEPVKEAPKKPADKEDDYLPCKEYQGRTVNDKQNNVALFKHDNGQYYFAIYHKDGGVRLRSEGFPTAKERDVELSGALKNLDNKDLYSKIERGDYFMDILKDKTGREVGRSCLEKVKKAAPAPAAPKDKEDDYLPCKEYKGRQINDKHNKVAFFKHDNGQYYFAVYGKDGNVRLRSEGFRTAKERDVELSGALKNINNKDLYTRIERGDYYMDILKDKTGREVGRSCLEKIKKAAPVVAPVAAATAAVAATAAAKAKVPPKPEPKPEPVKEVVKEKKKGFPWWWLLLLLIPLLWFLLRGCDGCNNEAAVAPVPKVEEQVTPPVEEVEKIVEEEPVVEEVEATPPVKEVETITPAVGVEVEIIKVVRQK